MSQLHFIGVVANVRWRGEGRWMAFGAVKCVREVAALELCTQLPARSDNELNWAISPLDIRGGGIAVW